MIVRRSSYKDYGISKKDVKITLDRCRKNQISQEIINAAAEKANINLAQYLVESIVTGLSYEKLEKKYGEVNITKGDFYGYRRKAIAAIIKSIEGK